MLRDEALNVLGLGPGATTTEIKESYRDLVKVWHPDRLGSDPRLRQKAEEKLRQINDAYRVLQSPPKPDSMRVDVVGRRDTGSSAGSNKGGARSSRRIVGWICSGLGITVVVIAAMLTLVHDSPRAQVPVAPQAQPQGSTGAENHIETSPQKPPKVPLKNANGSNHTAARFRVRQLSDTEAAELESTCPREKEMRDPTAYQDCVRAQLGALAPDMSSLSADDRAGIESACRSTKIREGSAAYNRCLTRMIKLLNESSRP
ncbi:J domain-containing protein [Alloacidobacterium dinghuense]|uniref:J domain-containing protein n=1 Tax=Alloacidobacterium dinghuense TaxID=2763107 RepID=A0A7G8BJ74_9BACT|nr:J domain-containing protein [Alloacidobacterium dinghuense]